MSNPVSPTDTVFEVLAHEHRALEARFAVLHQQIAAEFAAARRQFPIVVAEILAHLHAEAAILLPRLAAIEALAPVLARRRADHAQIEADALRLTRTELTPSEWLRGVRRLEADLVRLIEREETHVFPTARRALAPDESHALAEQLRAAEDEELSHTPLPAR